jgi:allantoicase
VTVAQREAPLFLDLVDLASAQLGGEALAASDDFFAEKANLLKPGRAVFLPDEYTDRGKWMDGWESRRKREAGHDWCLVRLGTPGVIRAIDVDTSHFLGNHPPFAAIEAAHTTDEHAASATFTEIVPQAPLRPGSQNLFSIAGDTTYTHVRLRIFPDGGVARLRVWGLVKPDLARAADRIDADARPHVDDGHVDLAALAHGGRALVCSDMFFGPMDNLILPGRAENMGGGWETRRKRAPGHDFIVVRLGLPGMVGTVEVDTNHFKGNCPDRCGLFGMNAKNAKPAELVETDAPWQRILPETKLRAHTRHFFRDQLDARGPFTHVRLDIFPDGGVSRLRVYGAPA